MKKLLFNISIMILLFSDLKSEEFVDPQGREFWLCFMQNHMDQVVDYDKLPANDPKRLHLDLFIASETDATVTIDVDSLYTHDIIKVKAGEVYNYKVSPFAQIKSSEIIEKGLSVHVRSDVPITVYGLNRRIKTTDTFLAYPIDALGKIYRTANYTISVDLVSEFALVATEDNTKVKIYPSVKTKDLVDSGNEISVTLNKGDIYQVLADKNALEDEGKSDLTGSLIVADKKIAVFSGHQCAYVPDDLWHCNHLVEQIPPVESWGRHYYLGKLQKRESYTVRVIADQADTKVFVDSKLKTTLAAGEFLEMALKNEVQITSNKRIMVAQYSHGSMRDSIGDPMMMMISPVQQYLTEYRFATPVNGNWNHSVDVIVPTDAIDEVFLDEQRIAKNKFKKFKNTRYSIAYLNVEFGNHVLKGAKPFGMSTYGFGYGVDQFDAYGNNGGQSFVKLKDLDTLAPTIELTNNKKNEIIFRDDRSNDKGLKSIKLIETENMFFASDLLVESTPQISVFPRIQVPNVPASIKIEAKDMAGNIAYYTICYLYNKEINEFEIQLNDGLVDCSNSLGLRLAVNLGNQFTFVNPDFSSLAQIESEGNFRNTSISNFNLGFEVDYYLMNKLELFSAISFTSFDPVLRSSDTTIGSTRDPQTDELRPYQEGNMLSFSSSLITLDLGVKYHLFDSFHAKLALSPMITSSKKVKNEKEILIPEYLNFPSETGREVLFEGDLEEINSLSLFMNLGLEYRKDFNDRYFWKSSINYNLGLGSYINNSNLNVSNWSLNIGAGIKL